MLVLAARCNFGLVLLHFVLVISSSAFFLSLWCVVLDFSFVLLGCHALPPPHSTLMVRCFVCGRAGHRTSECLWSEKKLAKSQSKSCKGKTGRGKGKGQRKGDPSKRGPEKCQFCGLIGHTHTHLIGGSFLRLRALPTSKPGPSADGHEKKRKVAQGIAALEQQIEIPEYECQRTQKVNPSCVVSPLEQFSHPQREPRWVWTVVQR